MQQTNRTLLLSQINSSKRNLLNFIDDIENKQGLSDEDLKMINSHLEIKSYDEMIEKFNPSINMKLDTDNLQVDFSLDSLDSESTIIRLDEKDSILNKIVSSIENKCHERYVTESFCDLKSNFFLRDNIDNVIRMRDLIINKMVMGENVEKEMKNFIEQFDDGITLIKTFIDDVLWYTSDEYKTRNEDKAFIDEDDSFQVQIVSYSKQCYRSFIRLDDEKLSVFQHNIPNLINDINSQIPIKNMTLVSNLFYVPVWIVAGKDEILAKKYNLYNDFYCEIVKKFWTTARPLIETLLGIKSYFEQYTNAHTMPPVMVISNFSINDLTNTQNRERFELYLETVNNKIEYMNTIWYAILPSVDTELSSQNKNIRERFQGNSSSDEKRFKNEIEETLLAYEILSKYKIASMVSFAINQDNTFAGLRKNGVEWLNKQLASFENVSKKEYLIPCYPNSIIIPKHQCGLRLYEQLVYDEVSDSVYQTSKKILWLDEIGIEASFIATGLVAACQCPEFLSQFYRRGIDVKTPGVAFRITENDNNQRIYTNILSETLPQGKEIFEQNIRNSRGVLLGQINGKVSILTEKTFAYNYGNQLLLSMIQTVNYMERIIRYETQDYKKNLIKTFFQRRPDSVMESWKKTGPQNINQILKEDEDIIFEIDDENDNCTFTVNFRDHGYSRINKVSIFKE